MAVPMASKAVQGLLAALLLLMTGAVPSGTPSPHPLASGTRPAATFSAGSAKLRKPRLPIYRTVSSGVKPTKVGLLTPSAPRSAIAIFKGLNQPGLTYADNGPQTVPPDSTGSIGPNHYVEFVNSVIGVYNRSDLSSVAKTDFGTFLGTGDPIFTPVCDPQIQWDPSSQRWLFVILGCDFTQDRFFYGWSKTPDPSDLVNGWCSFSVSTPGVLGDYPKLGHSSKYMLVGSNNFSDAPGNAFVTAQITWMLTPDPGVTSCVAPIVNKRGSAVTPLKNGDGVTLTSTPVPVNTSTNAANGYIISAYDPSGNPPVPPTPQTKLTVFHVDGSGAFFTDGDLTVNSYAIPTPAPNLGGSMYGIDTLDGRLTQAVGDPTTGIYTQHTVNGAGGRSKVTWYEIKVISTVPKLIQEGDITSSTDFVFNGAISPRSDGQGAVIFYNRSSAAIDPVIAAQGRMIWTPAGQMDPGEIVLASSIAGDSDFSCNFTGHGEACRWGDYSGASPDPLNPNVVWGSNQALTTRPDPFGDPNWVTQNFAIAGPLVRSSATQSSPMPTPTRGAANPGPAPAPPGTR
jgi:hypothetical protein